MARILITGAGGGLGLGAARELFDQGHTLIAHARSADRASGLAGHTGVDVRRG